MAVKHKSGNPVIIILRNFFFILIKCSSSGNQVINGMVQFVCACVCVCVGIKCDRLNPYGVTVGLFHCVKK